MCSLKPVQGNTPLDTVAALRASNLKASLDATCDTAQALTDLDAARERGQAEMRHLREGFQQQLEEARTLGAESRQAAAAAADSVGQWRNRWGGLSCTRDGPVNTLNMHVGLLRD